MHIPIPTSEAESFFVISVRHTEEADRYITIWRPDGRGYCWALSRAGRYDRERVLGHLDYYNRGDNNVAVPCAVLDAVAIAPVPGHHDNDTGPVIENNKTNWKLILANLIAPAAEKTRPAAFRLSLACAS